MIIDCPRDTSRPLYKYLHRIARISAREAQKACIDMLIYGQGTVRVTDGWPEHVPHGEAHGE